MRLVSLTRPDGRVWQFSYTSDGRLSSFTDPAGQVTTVGYGKANRVVSVTRADGTVRGFKPLVLEGLAGAGEGDGAESVCGGVAGHGNGGL